MGKSRLRGAIDALVRNAGSLSAFVRNRRRRTEPGVPMFSAHLRQRAVADPLTAMWTELNWLVTDDPWMDHSLTDVDRVIALLSQPEEPSGFLAPSPMSALDSIDIDAILNQIRLRRSSEAAEVPEPRDPLETYLRSLGTRGPSEVENPLVAVLARAR